MNLPELPENDGVVEIAVRDENQPERSLPIHIRYPGGALSNVTATTGLMLSMHNWGGWNFIGAPNPDVLTREFNVIAIGADYLHSGDQHGNPANRTPYDFAYFQTMDALRALHYVFASLRAARHPFHDRRLYACGGSGGGIIAQMANKFAPHTFACIVDLSGPASLTDEIAYGLIPDRLNARYSRETASPAYLPAGMQEIRNISHPAHLAVLAQADNRCMIVVIHGEDDGFCLASDKHRAVDAMRRAGLAVDAHFIGKQDIDGKEIVESGHGIGDRAALLCRFAGRYLSPASQGIRLLGGPCDFERGGSVALPVTGGRHVISFTIDGPHLRFERSA